MVKIQQLETNMGTTNIEALEFNGTVSNICADIGVITKVLLDKAFKDKDDKAIATFTIATNLLSMK